MNAQSSFQSEPPNDDQEDVAYDMIPVEDCEMEEDGEKEIVQQFLALKVQNPVVQAAAAMPETRKEVQEAQRAAGNPSTSGNSKTERGIQTRRRRRSRRERRKYDHKGRLLCNGLDMCDCLQLECSGCFYPCPKCNSKKCGVECRCSRKWVYNKVEDQPGDVVNTFPFSHSH